LDLIRNEFKALRAACHCHWIWRFSYYNKTSLYPLADSELWHRPRLEILWHVSWDWS
jgi:hypothetical protein